MQFLIVFGKALNPLLKNADIALFLFLNVDVICMLYKCTAVYMSQKKCIIQGIHKGCVPLYPIYIHFVCVCDNIVYSKHYNVNSCVAHMCVYDIKIWVVKLQLLFV